MTTLLCQILDTVLNRYIRFDPQSQPKLVEFEGKMVKFVIQEFNTSIYLEFQATKIEVSSELNEQVDVTIEGTLFSLFKLAIQNDAHETISDASVQFAGDVHLGQQIQAFFQSLSIDWEEQFAQLVGDVFANHIFTLLRKMCRFVSTSTSSVKSSIKEYIHEESHAFPSKHELDKFYEDVSDVRMALDRLDVRFKRWQDNKS